MAAEDLDDQYTCYYPDKSIDLKGFACNGTTLREGGASACCLPNDICFSNGACYQDWSGVMYRLSCTDPTFRDPACAPWCLLDGSYVPHFDAFCGSTQIMSEMGRGAPSRSIN